MTLAVSTLHALRALYDCRIVRAHMGSSAFGQLVSNGFAERRYITGREAAVKCDYRLAPRGQTFAESVPWRDVYVAS